MRASYARRRRRLRKAFRGREDSEIDGSRGDYAAIFSTLGAGVGIWGAFDKTKGEKKRIY